MVLASDKTTLPKEGKMDLDSVEGITGNQRMAEEGGMGFKSQEMGSRKRVKMDLVLRENFE